MEARSLILAPEQYKQVPAYDLLRAAEDGFVGLDHRFLHALVDDPERSIPDLLRFGLEDRPNSREDLSDDLVNILRHLRTPQMIPCLLEFLRRDGLDAGLPMISSFREIGQPAVEPLLAFYKEVSGEEDSDVAFLLASLGVRDARILEALLALLETDAVEAAQCLAAYGDPAAIPAIREALAKFKGDEWMRRAIASSLHELEAGPRPPVEEDEPFDLWDLYPPEEEPHFDLLIDQETELFLDSPDAANRLGAVVALSALETPKRLWDRLLTMAREDPSPAVRGKCWEALLGGADRADIGQAMRACLDDETAAPEERCGALVTVAAREGATAEVERAIRYFYERPDTRARAIEAMAVSQEAKFEVYFRKHLDDPDDAVSTQAMLGVGLLEMVSDAPRLVPYFEDEDLRQEALSSYAMAAAFEPSRAGLRRLFRKITDLAHGLTNSEELSVKDLLNARARNYDLEPVYGPDGEELVDAPAKTTIKIGRNDPCPCGSGKKYKKCCGG